MSKIKGIYAASMSIFNKNLSLNIEKTLAHAEKIIDQGCHGVAIFGSTGQAQLIPVNEKIALLNNISEETFDTVLANIQFLPNVIKYDRFQPEFYEDTKTYISKRKKKKKVLKGLSFYKKNLDLINTIEKNYNIEKELLLSLMGIETNFGTYVGKMDILSSLATLSFDERRSEFFSNELLILLRLIETKQIDYTLIRRP